MIPNVWENKSHVPVTTNQAIAIHNKRWKGFLFPLRADPLRPCGAGAVAADAPAGDAFEHGANRQGRNRVVMVGSKTCVFFL